MSEVVDVEATESGARITIEVTDENVKYDSTLSLPEVMFWMDVVRSMILRQVLNQEAK